MERSLKYQMSNSLRIDLKGKTVLLNKSNFKEGTDLRFKCEDGFGCSPRTNGTTIYGKWVSDNLQDKISGYDVESILNEKATSPEVA